MKTMLIMLSLFVGIMITHSLMMTPIKEALEFCVYACVGVFVARIHDD